MSNVPKPVCTVFGGTNGSGKSTLIKSMAPPGELVNVDEVARLIDHDRPENASVAAGRLVLRRLDELITERQSFHWETTLSSHQALRYMSKAKGEGFQTNLVFVVLGNVALNIARVRSRVADGGHDIPEKFIRRRYDTAFERLPKAVQMSDGVIIYDNTHKNDLKTLFRMEDGIPQYNALDEARMLHVQIAEALAAALDWSADDVFKAARP